AANVAGKAIGVLPDQRDRVGPVGLEDSYRPRCADAVALQEHHDLANDLLLGPTRGYAPKPRLPNSIDREQALRRALDYFEHALAKRLDHSFPEVRADPFDQAGAQIPANAF